MADFTLEAQPRTLVGKKVSQLRGQGIVPIVVYGPRTEPLALQVPYRPLELTLMKAGGTHLIDLKVNDKTITVLAREVQRDVLRGNILHADFFAVDESEAISADVHVHLEGHSPAVDMGLGILITGTSTITIETLPSKLLDFIPVNISVLKTPGDAIYVRDLNLGPDIKILNDPDEMIVRVAQTAAAMAEEEAEGTGALAEPEVIQRGKVEADEE